MKQHMASSHPEYSSRHALCVCGLCGNGYKFPSDLWTHIRTVHLRQPQDELNCYVCLQHFTRQRLREHMKQVHPFVECRLCGDRTCRSMKALTGHLNTHFETSDESKVRCYSETAVCGLCDCDFSTGLDLVTHIYTYHLRILTIGQEMCEFCKRVMPISRLILHKERKHAELKCRLCGEMCTWRTLRQHVEEDHD